MRADFNYNTVPAPQYGAGEVRPLPAACAVWCLHDMCHVAKEGVLATCAQWSHHRVATAAVHADIVVHGTPAVAGDSLPVALARHLLVTY
jgi:hypothetical protein